MFENRLKEINERKIEIRSLLNLDQDADLTALETELTKLDDEVKTIEKRQEIAHSIQIGETVGRKINQTVDKTTDYGVDSKEYRTAFFKKFAGVELNDVEKRAMTTNTTSAGYAVPTITMNRILEKIENDAIVYNLVNVSNLHGNISIPIEKTTNDVERKGEGEDGTILDDTLDELRLGAKKYIKLVRLTCELENTAIDALEDYIVKKLSKKLAQAIDYDIINGKGVKGAKGILETLTIQKTSSTEWTYDDVLSVIAGIPAAARKSATMLMSTNTLYKQVYAIKDDNNRPIFDVTNGTVLGRHVEECDDVPDGTIIFGDFSEYMFNWAKESELLKSNEVAFTSGDTVFRILALADGGITDLGALCAYQLKKQ